MKQALGKLGEAIDTQTGGSHHDQIAKATGKAEDYIDKQGAPRP